jgi:hypothetical protein
MRYVDPRHWPLALGAYVAGGVAFGFPWLEDLAVRAGLRGGMGTMVAINLGLPFITIIVAACYPRLRTALAGGLLVGGGFVLTRLLWQDWQPWTWSLDWIKARTSPFHVAATVGCTIIGVITVVIVNSFRVVGYDRAVRCAHCGYAIGGLARGICPECGREPQAPAVDGPSTPYMH